MRPRQWARREVGASEGGLAHEGTWEKQADFHFMCMCILLGEASLSMLRCFEKLERKEKTSNSFNVFREGTAKF